MSEWQLRWFSSQLRQLAPALERLSGGAVRWETPWARVIFRDPKGPMPDLSEAGQRVLLAALEAQRLIDRDAFAEEFLSALKTHCSRVFLLPNASQSDARQLADWCKAQAQNEGKRLVGRIDVPSGAPLDLASLIADLMEQWNEHLAACEDDVAIGRLKGFVGDHSGQKFMLLAVADTYKQELLQPVLDAVLQRTGDEDSRVCVLVCPAGEVPAPIVGVAVHPVDLSSFSSDDVRGYLERHYGYDAQGLGELTSKMERLDLLSTPARVYTYVEEHCDRQAWQNRFPDGAAGARPN
jgi:hypothetical protein